MSATIRLKAPIATLVCSPASQKTTANSPCIRRTGTFPVPLQRSLLRRKSLSVRYAFADG